MRVAGGVVRIPLFIGQRNLVRHDRGDLPPLLGGMLGRYYAGRFAVEADTAGAHEVQQEVTRALYYASVEHK